MVRVSRIAVDVSVPQTLVANHNLLVFVLSNETINEYFVARHFIGLNQSVSDSFRYILRNFVLSIVQKRRLIAFKRIYYLINY